MKTNKQNGWNLAALILGIVVACLMLLSPMRAQAAISDKWCVGADNLCVGQDGQVRMDKAPVHKVRSTSAVSLSSTTQIVPDYGYQLVVSSGNTVNVNQPQRTVKATYASGRSVVSGTTIILRGTSDTNVPILHDDDDVSGTKLELGASTRSMGLNDVMVLMYDSTSDRWLEISYNNLD